ncbi:MAG TPA: gamma-glutamyl-gamma-aminobutyrate hydrolase family protein [Terriglobia bacterium]|nr:gamma-glutamyl-gamma-aminobutyrate hydrolase family protein [Terriglobia bacterium]
MNIAVSVAEKEKAKGKESPYFKALLTAGALPEEIRLVTAGAPNFRAEDFDGILLGGGEDVDPALYDEEKRYDNVKTNRQRDDFELKLLELAQESQLPVFGICRGTQLINVKFGGTLYQDLEKDAEVEIDHKQNGARSDATHGVTLTEPESLLAESFHGHCQVNSFHHQAIKRVGRGLKVTAYSEDGLVEAVEAAEGFPYLVAVQWHPEEIADQPEQKKMLRQFLDRCRKTAEQRRKNATAAS